MTSNTTVAGETSPNLIAAIDIGSNSIHLVLAQLNTDKSQFRILEQRREKVRLAAGLNEHNELSAESMERGITCLKLFAQRLRGLPPESVAIVGTNALRKAINRQMFIDQAEAALNHKIEVISGIEEARLIYSGVSRDDEQQDCQRLVVDIGGGSTEFILGLGLKPHTLESLQLGCVSYTKRFFDGDQPVITAEKFNAALLSAKQELYPICQTYRQAGWDMAMGSSGTIRAIQKVLFKMGEIKSGIDLKGLKTLRQGLLREGSSAYLKSFGLSAKREQTFAAGVAVLLGIFESFEIDRMYYSKSALREGLLYDIIGKCQKEDIRDHSVKRLIERYEVDRSQILRVENTAKKLYEQFSSCLGRHKEDLQLIRWAAQLHEIGLAISHSRFHEHSGYLLKNMDLFGFGHHLQSELALIVKCHRKRLKLEWFDEFAPERASVLLKLTLLLRLAVILNHGRGMDEIPTVLCEGSNQKLVLTFPLDWLKDHPLTLSDLEEEKKYWLAVNHQLVIK